MSLSLNNNITYDIFNFLDEHIVQEGQTHTHTSMFNPKKSYFIKNSEIEAFYDLYEEAYNTEYRKTNRSILQMKCEDNRYTVRVLNSGELDMQRNKISTDALISNVRFITVKYMHPKMYSPIYIDLPRNYYIEGNELLSATFVLRCLEYQSEYYVFDLDYIINVIDNDIKSFQLTANEYVYIGLDSYQVIA